MLSLILVMGQFFLFAALFIFPGPFLFTRMLMSDGNKAAGGHTFAMAMVLSTLVWLYCGYGLSQTPMSIAEAVGSFVYKVGLVVPVPGLLQVAVAWAMPVTPR